MNIDKGVKIGRVEVGGLGMETFKALPQAPPVTHTTMDEEPVFKLSSSSEPASKYTGGKGKEVFAVPLELTTIGVGREGGESVGGAEGRLNPMHSHPTALLLDWGPLAERMEAGKGGS